MRAANMSPQARQVDFAKQKTEEVKKVRYRNLIRHSLCSCHLPRRGRLSVICASRVICRAGVYLPPLRLMLNYVNNARAKNNLPLWVAKRNRGY